MKRIRLTVAYDGTNYSGWQVQNNGVTIEGELNKALSEYNPDIVHSHLESSYSLIYCLLYKKYCVFTIHSFPDRIFTKQFRKLCNT